MSSVEVRISLKLFPMLRGGNKAFSGCKFPTPGASLPDLLFVLLQHKIQKGETDRSWRSTPSVFHSCLPERFDVTYPYIINHAGRLWNPTHQM